MSPIIEAVVEQHAEEAGFLLTLHSTLSKAPHVRLRDLLRLDERIEAHLDGLRVAGEDGTRTCLRNIEGGDRGAFGVAMLRAIETGDKKSIDMLVMSAEADESLQAGALAAFGWTSERYLNVLVNDLLTSKSVFRRCLGLTTCAMHRLDPGMALRDSLHDSEPSLRARALRLVGELGRGDLLLLVMESLRDKDDGCRFWGAWSAALLGERSQSLEVLRSFVIHAGPFRTAAFQLVLQAMDVTTARDFLNFVGHDPKDVRLLIHGAGLIGDPFYVPWLIKQMEVASLARLAGEAFSTIVGLDVGSSEFSRSRPAEPSGDLEEGPAEMEPEQYVPWPNPATIGSWWETHAHRFPRGTRLLAGESVSIAHCRKVLHTGFQRHRIAAAFYFSLLRPGTVLFPWRAPAERQRQWLSELPI